MKHVLCSVIIVLTGWLIAGCTTPRYSPGTALAAATAPVEMSESPRELPMFTGDDGRAMNWSSLLDAIDWADIVILGETHNDGMAHATQLAIVEDTFGRWPRSALAMEMLERDEQLLVDDYFDGIIDTATFVRLTFSENWGGPRSWDQWYQPIVDVARNGGHRLMAANAPRRYVRMARVQGYAALRALPRERRAYFDLPRALPRNAYFERFSEVMSHIESPAALDAMFRSQMTWDATMARSIVRARPSRSAKVVHLVGRFHSDFEGGLVQEIRRHRPWSRILVVSMIPTDSLELREEDAGRADVVIYTGALPEPEEPDQEDDEDEAADAQDEQQQEHPAH